MVLPVASKLDHEIVHFHNALSGGFWPENFGWQTSFRLFVPILEREAQTG